MENVLPLLKDNCVSVIDNAPYHSMKKEKIPNTSTRKTYILHWLQEKGEVIDRPMVIAKLLDIVKRIKPQYEKYLINELAQTRQESFKTPAISLRVKPDRIGVGQRKRSC